MRYAAGADERGLPIDVRDPLADMLRRAADAAGPSPERLAPALLGVIEIFGSDLPADPRFREAVTQALATLTRQGALRAVGMAGTGS